MKSRRFLLYLCIALIACASALKAQDIPRTAMDEAAAKVSWDEVKAAYTYDHTLPLNIEIREQKDMGGFTKIYFSYDSLNGGRVPAVIMMPKPHVKPMKADKATVPGAYPAMFLMHFHVSDKGLSDIFATWPGQGIAIMAIDGVFRGERAEPGKDVLMPDPIISAKHMQMQIMDILRGFDVLSQWEGIDPGRIGYMGISMGAQTGMAAVTLDPRIKSVIIADGAADYSLIFENSEYGDVQDIKEFMRENNVTSEQLVEAFKYVEPAIFAPRLNDRPVLLMNGKQDTTMTLPAMEKLHAIIGTEKKKIIWYDSGHVLPFDRVVGDALKWFKSTL